MVIMCAMPPHLVIEHRQDNHELPFMAFINTQRICPSNAMHLANRYCRRWLRNYPTGMRKRVGIELLPAGQFRAKPWLAITGEFKRTLGCQAVLARFVVKSGYRLRTVERPGSGNRRRFAQMDGGAIARFRWGNCAIEVG
jgi:hypothetical protein